MRGWRTTIRRLTMPDRGLDLDPHTDGRPDPRPDVRENAPQLGDLRMDSVARESIGM